MESQTAEFAPVAPRMGSLRHCLHGGPGAVLPPVVELENSTK